MTARIDPEMLSQLAGDPETELQAIVSAQDGLEALLAALPADVRVDHTYTLISSVCITTSAATMKKIVEMPVVRSIEPVRGVGAY